MCVPILCLILIYDCTVKMVLLLQPPDVWWETGILPSSVTVLIGVTTSYLVHGFTTALGSCCWELSLKTHHTLASGFWMLVCVIDGQEGLGTVDWDKSSLTKILTLVIILPCFQRKETKRLLPKCKILPSVKVPYLVTCTLLCLQ